MCGPSSLLFRARDYDDGDDDGYGDDDGGGDDHGDGHSDLDGCERYSLLLLRRLLLIFVMFV